MGSAYPRGAYPRGTWSYDGSLEGLLQLAYRAFSEGTSPDAVANAFALDGELFALLGPEPLRASSSPTSVDGRAAEEAGKELRCFSGELFDMILRIWMSEEGLELPLFRLCAEAGLHGTEVLADHGNADLRAVSRASRRVNCEIHRLTGLARFSPIGGLYLARLEPDYNVVAALLPHFARRFGAENFAMVDVGRRLFFARREGRFESAAGDEALASLPEPIVAEDEGGRLWRRYFKAAENPARRNPEQQRRLMPRRYWRYLPELG